MRALFALTVFSALLIPACVSSSQRPTSQNAATQRVPRDGYLPGADGVGIFYRILGNGPDTVVAVHGGPGAGMNAILPELAPLAEHHTIIFYDQRGGGRSQLPADTTLLSARHFIEDLEAVRRFFKFEKMTLIGHSMGSVIVARYAQDNPKRVQRIIFFGAVGPTLAEAGALRRAMAARSDTATQRRLVAVLERLMTGSTLDPVTDCHKFEAIGREVAIEQGESGRWKGTNCAMSPEALRYYFRYTARVGVRTFGRWDFTKSLGEVEAPVLVIYGDSDPKMVELQRAWANAFPNGRLLVIPGAGKGVSADRPDLFFPAVESFLSGKWPEGVEPA